MTIKAVRVPARTTPKAAIIFLHGLGDQGSGWRFLAEEAARRNVLPHVNFVFPDAPVQPVTLNFDMAIPSWYDIPQLNNVRLQQDTKGILESTETLKKLIIDETTRGIPTNRIIIGGFSQGFAVSIATLLTVDCKLGGWLGLSGYLPIFDTLKTIQTGVNINTAGFHGHGTADNVIKYEEGKASFDLLQKVFGQKNFQFHSYEGLVHSVSPEELNDIFAFLIKTLPEE